MKCLEKKYTISEMKSSLDGLNRRLHNVNEKISESEDKA